MTDVTPALQQQLIDLAKLAGRATLAYFSKSTAALRIQRKPDRSFLTEADLRAHQVIEQGLNALPLKLPILSEEGEHPRYQTRHTWEKYWLVDPLDGTRGFIAGCSEYTINIALIKNNSSVFGVIYAPALELCYYAAKGLGAFKQQRCEAPVRINSTRILWPALRVVMGKSLSKTRLLRLYEDNKSANILRMNSSLKFCWIAEGQADLYPRLGDTGEWDTAAGQCILEEAGGAVINFANQALRYNVREGLINPSFLAVGDPDAAATIIQTIQEKRRFS